MEQNILKCICNNKYKESEFKSHFTKCFQFKEYFNDFDYKLSELIKIYSEPKDNLLLINYLLKLYTVVIEKKIKESFPNYYNISSANKKIKSIFCQTCKKNKNIFYLNCNHTICNECFEIEAKINFYQMKCNICSKEITEKNKKDILKNKFEELEKNALIKIVENNENDKTNIKVYNEIKEKNMDENDDEVVFISKLDMNENENNKTNLNLNLKKNIKCRYCSDEITQFNKGKDFDVCNSSLCKERYILSCKKKLPCGHKCFGVDGEKVCPPCIDSDCKNYSGKLKQNKESYCSICNLEGLGSSPIVISKCGHYFHYQCVKKQLETKWLGPQINFNFCLCPECNKWLDIDTVSDFAKMLNEYNTLYNTIKEMALIRLKLENLDKSPKLTDPNSPWYNKQVEFALRTFAYFMCSECKTPYFAGKRECGNNPSINLDETNTNFNPEYCVCSKHVEIDNIKGENYCNKHGKEFIEYKCKFCCKYATWFCWGTTHFCDDCYKRQCLGDYVSQYSKDKLDKCNKNKCQVGGNHPLNGEEYALGCFVCKYNLYNQKN